MKNKGNVYAVSPAQADSLLLHSDPVTSYPTCSSLDRTSCNGIPSIAGSGSFLPPNPSLIHEVIHFHDGFLVSMEAFAYNVLQSREGDALAEKRKDCEKKDFQPNS
jgi:hypothetical protein